MHNTKETLLNKYIQGDITKDEFVQLMDNITGDKTDFSELDTLWLESQNQDSDVDKKRLYQRFLKDLAIYDKDNTTAQRSKRRLKKAVLFGLPIIAVLCVGLWKWMPTNTAIAVVTHDLQPASYQSELTFANGKSMIVSDKISQKLLINGDSIINDAPNKTIQFVAKAVYPTTQENNIVTKAGNTYKIILPDGSLVYLNASSKLSFPSQFGDSTREVSLSGEGYFEVAKNAHKPFIVHSGQQSVQVLGTHFNINTFNKEAGIVTTLTEGHIKISGSNKATAVYLSAGQQAIFKDNKPSLQQFNAEDSSQNIAWKNGRFSFQNTPAQDVLAEIARWYNAQIQYEGAIPSKRITGEIYRDTKASDVLELIRYQGINCHINNNTIIISSTKNK